MGRLLNSGDTVTVDFVLFRLRHINRHLLQFERYSEVVRSIAAVIIYMKKSLDSDWLRKECSFSVTRVQNNKGDFSLIG